MIKCVVFDFDGTLVDSNAIKRQTFFDIARRWDTNGEVVSEVLQCWPSANRYEKIDKIAEGLISKKTGPGNISTEAWIASMVDQYTVVCEKAISSCAEMPGVTQTLNELAEKGLCLFINSATPVEPLQKVLKLRGWQHFFQAVFGAENSKATNLQQVASATGAKPHEMVHVGDQLDDVQGANAFGCHFIAMISGSSGPLLNDCPVQIQNLQELPDLLSKLSGEVI